MTVRIERDGRVALITLDRPEARNAIDSDTAKALDEALTELDHDDSIGAAVLTGAGDIFCAGADLKQAAVTGGAGIETANGFAGVVRHPFTKPLIAAVNGPALAGGFEIALACDLIVASESAYFSLPEVRHGLIAGAGGLVRLATKGSAALALQLGLTAQPIAAERLYALGLVSDVVPAEDVVERAMDMARAMATFSPIALRLTKQVIRDAESWDANERAVLALRSSSAMLDGAKAFAEGRKENTSRS